jgi:hypothetical protein
MREQDRIAEFRKRGHTNPPTYKPNTPGWQRLCRRREKQLYELKDTQQRWDGFTSLMCSGVVVNNFTRLGFQVATVPGDWHAKLRAELETGLSKKLPTEASIPHIRTDPVHHDHATFHSTSKLNLELLHALQPMHEQWSGQKLQPVIAYGLRVYPNGSSLLMHVDKVEDHVVSSIVHVGHDAGSEPWPVTATEPCPHRRIVLTRNDCRHTGRS